MPTSPDLTARASAAEAARGMVLVALGAMLWGTTGTAQSLAPTQFSPYWLGALRLLIGCGFFALLAWLLPGRAVLGSRQWPWGRVLLAGVCIAVYNLSFFAGVKLSGVALGTALAIGSGPIWAGLLQICLTRRWPAALWWLGTLVSVAGSAAMALGQGGGLSLHPVGILLCLLAGLSYATYTLVNKPLVLQLGPAQANGAVFSSAALLSVPSAWWLAGALPVSASSAAGWGVVLFLGVVSTGLAYLLFSNGLRYVSGATGVTLALCEPVTAFVLAVWVVGEPQQLLAYLGLLAVIVGLLLVAWEQLRPAV